MGGLRKRGDGVEMVGHFFTCFSIGLSGMSGIAVVMDGCWC
jgi:hypothetical protein